MRHVLLFSFCTKRCYFARLCSYGNPSPMTRPTSSYHVQQQQEFAELLVSKGASASHRDTAGASVLVHAAHARMPKLVKALLAAGATAGVEVDAASDEGVTALIAAAIKVFFVFHCFVSVILFDVSVYSSSCTCMAFCLSLSLSISLFGHLIQCICTVHTSCVVSCLCFLSDVFWYVLMAHRGGHQGIFPDRFFFFNHLIGHISCDVSICRCLAFSSFFQASNLMYLYSSTCVVFCLSLCLCFLFVLLWRYHFSLLSIACLSAPSLDESTVVALTREG